MKKPSSVPTIIRETGVRLVDIQPDKNGMVRITMCVRKDEVIAIRKMMAKAIGKKIVSYEEA